MKRANWRIVTANILLIALVPWCVGCATGFYVKSGAGALGDAGVGALEVRVFDHRSDLRNDVTSSRDITTELYLRDSHPEKLIRHERTTHWTASDLAPGRYVLRVWRAGEKQDGRDRRTRPAHKKFVVVAGQTVVADVVLKDGKKTFVYVAVGAVAVIALTYGYIYVTGWSPISEAFLAGMSF